MGANVLAFTPARYAVFGEGGTDLLLLPSLLREATERDHLDFQVVPGLAEVGLAQVRDLDLEAGRVCHLVDGDDGGKKIRRVLKRGGVPDTQIVTLGGSDSGHVV